jgi:hypothetical protein
MGAPGSLDFLLSLLALSNLMRLSLMKAAYLVLVAPRAGNPDTWAENDIFRSLFLAPPWICWR